MDLWTINKEGAHRNYYAMCIFLHLKITIFLEVIQCNLGNLLILLAVSLLHAWLTLKMEAVWSPNADKLLPDYIPEVSNLQSNHHENLKSHT
jgi:hypothetical protein